MYKVRLIKKYASWGVLSTVKKTKELRKCLTKEEDIMYGLLRCILLRYRVKRKYPFLFYEAGFYCHKLKPVIKIGDSIYNKKDVNVNDKKGN